MSAGSFSRSKYLNSGNLENIADLKTQTMLNRQESRRPGFRRSLSCPGVTQISRKQARFRTTAPYNRSLRIPGLDLELDLADVPKSRKSRHGPNSFKRSGRKRSSIHASQPQNNARKYGLRSTARPETEDYSRLLHAGTCSSTCSTGSVKDRAGSLLDIAVRSNCSLVIGEEGRKEKPLSLMRGELSCEYPLGIMSQQKPDIGKTGGEKGAGIKQEYDSSLPRFIDLGPYRDNDVLDKDKATRFLPSRRLIDTYVDVSQMPCNDDFHEDCNFRDNSTEAMMSPSCSDDGENDTNTNSGDPLACKSQPSPTDDTPENSVDDDNTEPGMKQEKILVIDVDNIDVFVITKTTNTRRPTSMPGNRKKKSCACEMNDSSCKRTEGVGDEDDSLQHGLRFECSTKETSDSDQFDDIHELVRMLQEHFYQKDPSDLNGTNNSSSHYNRAGEEDIDLLNRLCFESPKRETSETTVLQTRHFREAMNIQDIYTCLVCGANLEKIPFYDVTLSSRDGDETMFCPLCCDYRLVQRHH